MPLEATNTSPANEVPAEAAYMAARDRAMRTTQALMDAEARIVDLSWRLDQATGENQQLRADLREAQKPAPCPFPSAPCKCREVTHDATSDEGNRPTAGGEAYTPHPFSD